MKVCVIGAKGRMGALFSALLRLEVNELYELDLPVGRNYFLPEDLEFSLKQADLVLVCVHAFHIESVLKVAAPLIKEGAVLADIASVKELPMQLMQKYYKGPVVGTHPLFGPESNVIINSERDGAKGKLVSNADSKFNKVAIVQGESAEEAHVQLMEKIFKGVGLETFRCDAEEHDRSVALVQGLNFISHLAYFSLAAKLPNLKEFVTPSFMRRLEAAKGQLTEDGELFMGIAKNLPVLPQIIDEYIEQLNGIRKDNYEEIAQALEQAKTCCNAG